MSILLDTNILARTAQPLHTMHQIANRAVATLIDQDEVICVVPQVLFEFWSVGTRPLIANGLGLSIPDAEAKLAQIKAAFILLDETPAALHEWERLVVLHQVLGKAAHDTHLVAAMVVHGVDRILTFNKKDFQRYPSIIALSPDEIVQAQVPQG